jgi:hypothetical protein
MLLTCCKTPKPVTITEDRWQLGDDAPVLVAVMVQCGACGVELEPWRDPTYMERRDHATVLPA